MPDRAAPGTAHPDNLSLTLSGRGVAWIHIAPRSGSEASITIETLRELEELLTRVEALATEGSIAALALSASPAQVGRDGYTLDLPALAREEVVVAWSHEGQRILRLLETQTFLRRALQYSEDLF